jgi:hypothetical protein
MRLSYHAGRDVVSSVTKDARKQKMKRHRHVVPKYISPTSVPNALYMMFSTLGAGPIVVLISFLCCW